MVAETSAKVTYVELLKEDLAIIRLVPKGGMPGYKTGQFLTIGLPIPAEKKIVRRAYSIASHPENRDYFEFVIRWVRKPLPGRVTTELFYLGVGDEVTLGEPTGAALQISNTLHDGKKDTRRVICVGGGTGLAPFIAFANHFHQIGDKREVIVLHGASYVDELSYKRLLTDLELESESAGRDKWNFRYRAAISRPKEFFNRSWSGHVGRVESFFKPDKKTGLSPVEEMVGEELTPENTIVYICGYQGTIDGVIEYLGSKGFVTEHEKKPDGSYGIKFESYG
ncbi:MAG: ferredoxin--NADP reductase [Nitrosopumilus sp. B06]|nr:MAG: ferredoxin--NADP reductase [Nitrosopumilus sp. D6]RNJ79787.1 MAG: ferredoxin--NADP reductase [Nitrosopumilus sp. B06]